MIGRGIALRIALAAMVSAAVGLAILAVGVAVVGADIFTSLMMEAGDRPNTRGPCTTGP
jgi:hypothetical protein